MARHTNQKRKNKGTEKGSTAAASAAAKTRQPIPAEKAARLRLVRKALSTAFKEQTAFHENYDRQKPQNRQQTLPRPDLFGLGIKAVDSKIGGLDRAGVHHITGTGHRHRTAALSFCLALVKCLRDQSAPHRHTKSSEAALRPIPSSRTKPVSRQKILWVLSHQHTYEFGAPYGQGLHQAGLDPADFIFTTAPKNIDVLWAMEEALKSGALFAVIGEVAHPSFTATKRLALAARTTCTPCFLMESPLTDRVNQSLKASGQTFVFDNRARQNQAQSRPAYGSSAATSRWYVEARPGTPNPWDKKAPGHRNWHIELVRNRGGRPCSFTMEWNCETHTFSLAAQPRPQSPHPAPHPSTEKSADKPTGRILPWKNAV